MNTERLARFELPQPPRDEWVARQYVKYGLGVDPSLERIEPVATELLANLSTVLIGAELVLGRRVDGDVKKEPEVLPLLFARGLTGRERFGLLLMLRSIEEAIAAKPETQVDNGTEE